MKIHKSKKRAVESEVQKGWNTFVALFALEVKIGLGVVQLWTESEDGKQKR